MNNPKNHRLGLRVLGYFVLIFVLYWIINLILGVIPNWFMKQLGFSDDMRTYLGSTLTYGLRLITVIALSTWALRKAIGENPWEIMFPRKTWWKDLLSGILLTAAVMLSIFMLEIYAGWLVIDSWNWQNVSPDIYFRSMWLAILINLFVAVSEEAMFRGFLLYGLKKSWGTINALSIMAFIFACLHLGVSGADETFVPFFILLLSIPGVVLGLSFLQSRGLWLPIGIHFAWNLMQDEVLNLHGRGAINLIGAVTQQNGLQFIVGTKYGIETGLAGALAMGVICIGIWCLNRRKRERQGGFI